MTEDASIETSEREACAPVPSHCGVSTKPESFDHFIQPKVSGYRQLTTDEVALMNEAKALGAQFEELAARLRRYHQTQRDAARGATSDTCNDIELERLNGAEPECWLAMGRTDIQTGVMKIVRSIAQPAS